MIDFRALAAPFEPEEVSWRLGSVSKEKMRGMALAFVDARTVMDRLDDVCGPAGWQCRYSHANGKTVCDIGILCDGEWIWKADGAGDTDIEQEKGALSDAFKRAAVRWGIGRYLYMLDSPWVEIEEAGRSFRIRRGAYKELEMILRRFNHSYAAGEVNQPSAISQARDDIAQMQVNGEQPVREMKSQSRLAAELFASRAIMVFRDIKGGASVADWYNAPFSEKGTKTNRDKLAELAEKHPDLHQKVEEAAEQARASGGAILQ
ncbi:MAG: Rad52/Rad22 family DNA repair protein [Pseudomonadota bacterium]